MTARPPTTQRIAGSCASRSASLTSSYPASRPNTACRNHGLPKLRHQGVASVAAGARIGKNRFGQLGQPERFVEVAEGKQPGIGGDLRAVKL